MLRAASVIVSVIAAIPAWGQFPFTRSLDVRSGRSAPRITCLVQDRDGAIWTGSDVGLLRTDGDQVDAIWRSEPDKVVALAERGNDILAMSSSGVLLRCDGFGCDTLVRDTSWVRAPVRAMASDEQGNLWLATFGGGLHRVGTESRSIIGTREGLPDVHVNDLAILKDGRVVVATDQGIALIANERVVRVFEQGNGAPDNLVLSVAVDEYDGIWAGTAGSGVFKWDPLDTKAEVLPFGKLFGAVHCLLAERGRIWAATELNGLVMMEAKERGSYQWRQGSEQPMVTDMVVDGEGAVWWCDGSEVLQRSDPRVLHVPDHEGVDLHRVTALCTDSQGSIWFATPKGTFTHSHAFTDAARITRLPMELPSMTPLVSISAGEHGEVWGASFGGGLWRMGKAGVEPMAPPAAPRDPNILSVLAQGDDVWTATLAGISVLRQGRNSDLDALGTGFVYQLVASNDGSLLAATDGHGVVRVDQGKPQEVSEKGPRTFYTVAEGKDGTLWAGGPATGLCRSVAGGWEQLGTEMGLMDADIHALIPFMGRMFVMGTRGVLVYHPVSGSWTDVSGRVGLEDLQMELNTAAVDTSGALWLATDRGLVRILADTTLLAPPPSPAILEVRMGDQRYRPDTLYRTSHDRSAVSMRYMSSDQTHMGSSQFEYRLLGLSEKVVRTRESELSFPALPPGDYRFEIRTLRTEGELPSAWTGFRLIVEPPWWQRPWVIALMLSAAAALVIALIAARDRRLRYKQRMEQEQVRFQLEALRSQVDPHFLFNSFNTLVELIETEPQKAVIHVDQLSTFFRNILQVRDRELITLDEELDLLRTYVGLEQRRFGEAIVLQVELPERLRTMMIVPLTLQLLVENAIKHNAATRSAPVTVVISSEDDTLVVRNNILPKLTPPRSTGFGLESIRKRYAALTERPVSVERGTHTFVVRIPLIAPNP